MAEPLLIGLDVGTTATKAVAFGTDGRQVACARADTPWRRTPEGTELDAHQLADAVRSALAAVLAELPDRAPRRPVAAVGVASMAEAGVLLDRAGRSVAPVIAWHDRRDHREVAELADQIGPDRFRTVAGLPLRGQWSLTKQRWLTRHRPDSRTAVCRLNVAEWIAHALGGERATEQSLASRTGWLRLRERAWWTETLEWSGTAERVMPPLRLGGESWGRADRDAAGHPRLAGAVLTVAGHDHQAAAVGLGVVGVGDELDSCGTAEALVRTVAAGLPDAGVAELAAGGVTVGWHVLPGRWCLLGATEGGLTLGRTLRRLGMDPATLDPAALAELDAAALTGDPDEPAAEWRADAPGGPAPGSPAEWRADAPGGPAPGSPAAEWRAVEWRAALERVTGEAAELHRLMTRLAGPSRRLVATGGWSRSAGLMAVKRRVLGPLDRAEVGEAGARGAAMLAGLAAGLYASPDELPGLVPGGYTGPDERPGHAAGGTPARTSGPPAGASR